MAGAAGSVVPLTTTGPDGLVDGALDDGALLGAEDPLEDGCGVEGTDGVLVGSELGLELGGVDGLDEEPPSPIDRIGDGEEAGLDAGPAAGVVDSLFTVELLDEDVGAGLNTPLTVVPSQLSGFHQVAEELGLGVLLGAAGAVLLLVGAGAAGAVVGAGLAGAVVPDGALEGRADGAEGCGVVGAEVGSGAPGLACAEPALVELELELELGAELGADDDGAVAPALAAGFAMVFDPAAQFVAVCAEGVEDELAAFATVGITAAPVAARKTAGTPIAVTMRARLECAASTRRTASAVSSGVGTAARGLFRPPPRERSGTSSGSGSGPASSANTPESGAGPARRARSRASSTASSPADPLARGRHTPGVASQAEPAPLTRRACGSPGSDPAVFSFPLLPVALKTQAPRGVSSARGSGGTMSCGGATGTVSAGVGSPACGRAEVISPRVPW